MCFIHVTVVDIGRKSMDKKKKQFVINTLRRASYRWPTRGQAEKRSRVERGVYKCEYPGCTHQGKRGEFAMDHIVPVVDPAKGFTTFDEYIDRMFPDSPDQWQRLCTFHHDLKTEQENSTRKETKKKRKK